MNNYNNYIYGSALVKECIRNSKLTRILALRLRMDRLTQQIIEEG